MSEHTPEQWEQSESVFTAPNVTNSVATHYVRIFRYSGPIRSVVADVFGYGIDDAIARGQLIASAPLLSERVKTLEAENERLKVDVNYWQKANDSTQALGLDAIKKLESLNAELVEALSQSHAMLMGADWYNEANSSTYRKVTAALSRAEGGKTPEPCDHRYSRSIHKPRPRKCVICGEIEGGKTE